MTIFFVNGLVQGDHRAEEVLVLVVITGDVFAFDKAVTIELHLFASDTAAVGDSVGYCSISHGQCFHFVQCFALVCHSFIKNGLRQLDEVCVFGYEVCFAFEGDDGTKAIVNLAKHTTFGSFSV